MVEGPAHLLPLRALPREDKGGLPANPLVALVGSDGRFGELCSEIRRFNGDDRPAVEMVIATGVRGEADVRGPHIRCADMMRECSAP